jgi:hypothetical protein
MIDLLRQSQDPESRAIAARMEQAAEEEKARAARNKKRRLVREPSFPPLLPSPSSLFLHPSCKRRTRWLHACMAQVRAAARMEQDLLEQHSQSQANLQAPANIASALLSPCRGFLLLVALDRSAQVRLSCPMCFTRTSELACSLHTRPPTFSAPRPKHFKPSLNPQPATLLPPQVWDTNDGGSVCELEGSENSNGEYNFSPDSALVCSGYIDPGTMQPNNEAGAGGRGEEREGEREGGREGEGVGSHSNWNWNSSGPGN